MNQEPCRRGKASLFSLGSVHFSNSGIREVEQSQYTFDSIINVFALRDRKTPLKTDHPTHQSLSFAKIDPKKRRFRSIKPGYGSFISVEVLNPMSSEIVLSFHLPPLTATAPPIRSIIR